MTNNLSTVAVYPKLNDDWNVYYHLQNDKCWDLSSYKLIMTLQNVYDVIFYKRPDAGYHNKTLYFVRDAKRHYPTWEDSKNRRGVFVQGV
jgi:hypothetical protein